MPHRKFSDKVSHDYRRVKAELDSLWRDHRKMTTILERDLLAFRRRAGKNLSQPRRRSFIRSLFILIEAESAWMGKYVVAAWSGVLGDEERLLLSGKRALKNTHGETIVVPHHRSPAEQMFDAFDLFADTSGVRSPLSRSSPGWHALQTALKVRNRLTHPRCMNDLAVSDRELAAAYRADQWFHEELIELNYSCAAALFRTANVYREKLAEKGNTVRGRNRARKRLARAIQLSLELDVPGGTHSKTETSVSGVAIAKTCRKKVISTPPRGC